MNSIEERFKRYESVSDHYLVRRTPVIVRLDGRSFHTLTRDCVKPFDAEFMASMREAAFYLCKFAQGCKLAYVQSDEISLLLIDYDTIQTEPWFNNRINKICSISASIATTYFSRRFEKVGMFDCRVFNLPENDVCNYFVWRQKDAIRNSLSALSQASFSQKELKNKNSSDMHEMLFTKGVNWNDLHDSEKRGTTYIKDGDWKAIFPEFSKQREVVEDLFPREVSNG